MIFLRKIKIVFFSALENSLASKSQKDEHNENGSHVSQNIQFSTLLEKTIGDVTHKMRLEEKLGKIGTNLTLKSSKLIKP